jgi:hypothetical protein
MLVDLLINVKENIKHMEEQYDAITVYDVKKDMKAALYPSELEKLLNGKGVMFYYDSFHMHQ